MKVKDHIEYIKQRFNDKFTRIRYFRDNLFSKESIKERRDKVMKQILKGDKYNKYLESEKIKGGEN